MDQDVKDLRAQWKKVTELSHAAFEAQSRATMEAGKLNMMLGEAGRKRCVAQGFGIDYLGDGKVKPLAECAKQLAGDESAATPANGGKKPKG